MELRRFVLSDVLNEPSLDPNRVVAVIGRLGTIVSHIQLQVTIIVKTVYSQNLTDTSPKNLPCFLRHLLLNRGRHAQYSHSVSNL